MTCSPFLKSSNGVIVKHAADELALQTLEKAETLSVRLTVEEMGPRDGLSHGLHCKGTRM